MILTYIMSIFEKKTYIVSKINDLHITERYHILNMITKDPMVDKTKIQTKGDGTQIRFSDLSDDLIESIYVFINEKLADKMKNLNDIKIKS